MIGHIFGSRRASICAWVLLLLPVSGVTAEERSQLSATEQSQESFIEYHVRPGESLSYVAHLFRVPVKELAQLNNIGNFSQVYADRILKVPNVFARQIVQLREERNGLVAEKEQMTREIGNLQQGLAVIKADLQRTEEKAAFTAQLEREKAVLMDQLPVTWWWRRGMLALSLMLVGLLGWIFQLRRERARSTYKLTLLSQETNALKVAKEKYRKAPHHILSFGIRSSLALARESLQNLLLKE